ERKNRVAILFGPENNGLANDELIISNALIAVPVNLGYTSLNLAQAVAIMAYEFRINSIGDNKIPSNNNINLSGDNIPASKQETSNMLDHLEIVLELSNYFKDDIMKSNIIKNISNMFYRSDFSSQEIQLFRGIISHLHKTMLRDMERNNNIPQSTEN